MEEIIELRLFARFEESKLMKVPRSEGFALSLPDKISSNFFFDNQNIPNENGTLLITQLLIEALSANIHVAHQTGSKDSALHLREIIFDLERLFVAQYKIEISDEDPKGWLDGLENEK